MKSSWFAPPVNFQRDIKKNLAIWNLSDKYNVPEVLIENYLEAKGAEKEELLAYMKEHMKENKESYEK